MQLGHSRASVCVISLEIVIILVFEYIIVKFYSIFEYYPEILFKKKCKTKITTLNK